MGEGEDLFLPAPVLAQAGKAFWGPKSSQQS